MAIIPIPEHLASSLRAFSEDLRNRLGDALLSVTLYGSAARGDYIAGVSDINVLVVATALPASTLRTAGSVVKQWQEQIPLSPVFATPDYLNNSSDVFPLEFLDMRDWRLPVYGPDPLAGVHVDARMLRHQVEAELKGKLMRLRAGYARAAGSPAAVRDLIRDSLSSFRVLFEGVLHLHGLKPPQHRADIMRSVAREYALDAAALDAVVDLKEEGRSDPEGAEALFSPYLEAIEKLVAAVEFWSEDGVSLGDDT